MLPDGTSTRMSIWSQHCRWSSGDKQELHTTNPYVCRRLLQYNIPHRRKLLYWQASIEAYGAGHIPFTPKGIQCKLVSSHEDNNQSKRWSYHRINWEAGTKGHKWNTPVPESSKSKKYQRGSGAMKHYRLDAWCKLVSNGFRWSVMRAVVWLQSRFCVEAWCSCASDAFAFQFSSAARLSKQ